MQAGDLDQRVTLRRKNTTPNDYGTLVEEIEDLTTVWANVRPMSGRERDRAQQTESAANYLVTIRYRTGLTEHDFVVWRGAEMNIRFIRDSGPGEEWLSLECERGAK